MEFNVLFPLSVIHTTHCTVVFKAWTETAYSKSVRFSRGLGCHLSFWQNLSSKRST